MGWPKSLRWRYSLRALVVFVTLIMIWGAYHASRGWKQRAAERVLIQHGAAISYRTQKRPRDFGSAWVDAEVNEVSLNSNLTPDVIQALLALQQIELLSLQPRKFTAEERIQIHRTGNSCERMALADGALQSILQRHRIKELFLICCKLSDDDCRAIAQSDTLGSINLMGCDCSELGFRYLLSTPRLESLEMSFVTVTGDRLKGVPGSPSLLHIECRMTPLGNEFAAFVGRSPNVSYLSVAHPGIGDEFLSHLGPHPTLSQLGLDGTSVTDGSVASLQGLASLTHLGLLRQSLTNDAIGRLKNSNPRLTVVQQ